MRIYPGTKLYDLALAEGYLSPDDDLLEPVYYLAKDIDYATLKQRADLTGKRWVFPDEDVVTGHEQDEKKKTKRIIMASPEKINIPQREPMVMVDRGHQSYRD